MYCTRCGTRNDDNTYKCVQCATILHPAPTQQPAWGAPPIPPGTVPNYLAQAILVTIFCCLPFGIPAIVFASQVNGKLALGDMAGASAASSSARTWCWVSFGIWIAGALLYVVLAVALASIGALAGPR